MIFLKKIMTVDKLDDIDDDTWRELISPELDDFLTRELEKRKHDDLLKKEMHRRVEDALWKKLISNDIKKLFTAGLCDGQTYIPNKESV